MIVGARMQGKHLQPGKPQAALGGHLFPDVVRSIDAVAPVPDFFSPGGKRVLLPIPVEPSRSTTQTLVTNWQTVLTQQ